MKTIFRGQYDISELVESISLDDSIDGIAYTASISINSNEEFKKMKPDVMDCIDITYLNPETRNRENIFNGIIWERPCTDKIGRKYSIVAKEKTIYMEESEEEYLMQSGQTATQRIKKYCRDWGIPIGNIPNTGIALSKSLYRQKTIYDMMLEDLMETAQKGGRMYVLRMQSKLNLVELGSNTTVYKLESIAENIEESKSMDGVITQIKVVGKAEDDKKSPVIGTYRKNNTKYGTLQRIVSDDKIKNTSQARAKANSMFTNPEITYSVNGIDIINVRAGDRVYLNGKLLYVIDISHNLSGAGRGSMNATLASKDYIRRRFYSGHN